MDNPARAVADTPPRAAKGVAGLLKGKPPVFYVVLIAGVLAAAWLIRKREASQPPADTTASTITGDGSFSPDYTPTDGAYAGGYSGGSSGAVDQTGAYGGGPIPLGNGYIWDPSTGSVYGALPDAPADPVAPLIPSVPAGGGPPNNGGVEQHYPPPVVVGQSPQPTTGGGTWTCPSDFPNHGPNPGSCYKVVCLHAGDGHGHGKGKWHVYRDGSWHQVSTSC